MTNRKALTWWALAWGLWALLMVLLTACAVPTEQPEMGARIEPPFSWGVEYGEVWAQCGSTLRQSPAIPYRELSFFVVPGQSFLWKGQYALGLWLGTSIYLAESVVDWPVARRHEMLHAQLGEVGHPPIFAYCDLLALEGV